MTDHIDLDRARREAKRLLADARRGEPTARARLRADRPPRLADAQHAVALAHGMRTWPDLVHTHADAGTRLRRAATAGDDDALRALLEAGAPPNATDRRTGHTALLAAAAADQLDTVGVLVTWVPVDLHARDRYGRSALDLARRGSPVAAVLASCGLGAPRPPLGDEHAERADAAAVALLDHVARAPGVERSGLGDGFVARTGLADNTRNGVVCSRLPAGVDVSAVVARVAGIPACWYVDEGTDPADLRAQLEGAGCRAERSAVHMAGELDDLAGGRSARVEEVSEARHLVHLDADEARLLAAAGPPLRHFVIEGSAGLTTFTAGETVLGVHLRVDRAQRRRGLATMLVRHALAVAGDAGCTHAVLAPTAASVAFYERLGFTLERSRPDRWYYLP